MMRAHGSVSDQHNVRLSAVRIAVRVHSRGIRLVVIRVKAMDQFEIAKRMNMAENGRLFCVGLIIINLFVGHPLLAFLALLSIAAAIFVDMIPTPAPLSVRNGAALSVYAYTAVIAFVSFINLW